MPRYPHAIKILYHLMQMPFILVFGYNLFAARLISLLFGTATLYLIYKLALHLSRSPMRSLILTVILSVDVQFLYASHFARQDIIIAFGTVAVAYMIVSHADRWRYKNDIFTGVLIGLMIGIHPNSLMIALCAGGFYLYYIITRQFGLKNLLILVAIVALFAALFVGISFLFDSRFVAHYSQIGSNLGVDSTLVQKIDAFPGYFSRLFLRISGTYYTPPIQIQLIVFGTAVIAAIVRVFFDRKVLRFLLPVIGVAAGFVVIGRYSQPGVILFFPLCYLLVFDTLSSLLKKPWQYVPVLLAGLAVLAVTVVSVAPYLNRDYRNYLAGIQATVPQDAKVLANLNSEYAFVYDTLVDYRNLAYLEDAKMTFEEYIDSRGIEYIIYPEEMDMIYQKRPVWNIVYGNIYPYYEDMQRFFERRCTQIDEFTSPYAMRIVRYMDTQSWTIKIYAVQ
jgi:4-amino-4-deoxy-L-arabinose transferase-like glycosyltransferase